MLGRKILVAIDRSANAPIIFTEAIELAQLQKSQLLLVYIIDWEADDSKDFIGTIGDRSVMGDNLGIRKKYLSHKIEQAQEYLQDFELLAKAENISVEVKIEVEDPSQQICQIAKDWQADLIFVGSRGYDGITEVLLGSVSNYITHHAPCSVLIVRSSELSSR